jgi:quercetin dioxygenase-like cupin family protein
MGRRARSASSSWSPELEVTLFGRGLAQRKGGVVQEIRSGDVVWFVPGEMHWHGASPDTAMQHIAIHEALDGKSVDWLEHVSDEQYAMASTKEDGSADT